MKLSALSRRLITGAAKANRLERIALRRFAISHGTKCPERSQSGASPETLSLGQKTFQSHKEYFNSPRDITPGITKEDYFERRKKLCDLVTRLREDASCHILIVPAATKKYMTEDIPYPFRQDSNFFYLSGSYDEKAVIVMIVSEGVQEHILVLQDPEPLAELWDGPKTRKEAAVSYFGFNVGFYLTEFSQYISKYLKKCEPVFWCGDDTFFKEHFAKYFLKGQLNGTIESLEEPLATLRIKKTTKEIDLMRHSCKIMSETLKKTMQYSAHKIKSSELTEHDIWAKIDYESRTMGAERLAYPPVVASGSRAGVIHYILNCNPCHEQDLILVDAGCEYFGYCSDITRTWPLSGKFYNDHQRALYEMVLEVQTNLISSVAPGSNLGALFNSMGSMLLKGMQSLGIINMNSRFAETQSNLALRFCPHHVGHHLGMDVHDVACIEKKYKLESGMVITIEPGLYIQSNSERQKPFLTKVGREFSGIGIRIEDDVALTNTSCEVLSKDCPKSIKDMEICISEFPVQEYSLP